MASRDESVYMAKLAEQAERYDEMVGLLYMICFWGRLGVKASWLQHLLVQRVAEICFQKEILL